MICKEVKVKKVFASLVVAGLLLLGTSAFAAEVSAPEIQVPEVSLGVAVTDMKTAIEVQPVDFAAYVRGGIDYITEILSRLLKTGKPALLFLEPIQVGIECIFFESFLIGNLDLVGGLMLGEGSQEIDIPEDWKDRLYGGIEYEIPISDAQGIFSRLKIGGYGSKAGFCFGIAFELRPAE